MSLRTGGREAVEDTPVTGAIDIGDTIADGISNAVPRRISEHLAMGEIVQSVLEEIEHVGYAIVRAEDALTAEQRAAIGRALETFDSDTDLFIARSETDSMTDDLRKAYDRYHRAKQEFTTADRESLRTIAAGGQE